MDILEEGNRLIRFTYEGIFEEILDQLEPELVIIDSVQTICDSNLDSAPGSISQVRECTMRIMRITKERGLTVFLIGHITKEGSIAGPKILDWTRT